MGRKMSKKKQIYKFDDFFVEWMFSLLTVTLLSALGILLYKNSMQKEIQTPKFLLMQNTKQSLMHVEFVLTKLGFTQAASLDDDWDVLWAQRYPYDTLDMKSVKSHQKINRFPEIRCMTSKVLLTTTTKSKYIPRGFRVEKDLKEYAKLHPGTRFVQKNIANRGINLKRAKDIDFSDNQFFAQEFVERPLLIEGKMFDFGIYVILTSIDPVRIYTFKGEIVLRFCPQEYYPFNESNVDQYVIYETHLMPWQVPSIAKYYNTTKYSMKESLNQHLMTEGHDTTLIWDQVEDCIRSIILLKEPILASAAKPFRLKYNLFELMRFDFMIDESLQVKLIEINMSPNIRSDPKKAKKKYVYDQLLYNIFNLVGVGSYLKYDSLNKQKYLVRDKEMIRVDQDLAVDPKICTSDLCTKSCTDERCQLCVPCLTDRDRFELQNSYNEHLNRGNTRRLFPPAFDSSTNITQILTGLTPRNKMMTKWFYEKCKMDASWCQ